MCDRRSIAVLSFCRHKACFDASGPPLGDLHQFDLVSLRWTNLTKKVNGYTPSPRYGHGFASVDEKIFVHGGCTVNAGRALHTNRGI